MSDDLHDPIDLAARLGPVEERLMALDFDGVLSPIVEHPDLAAASPEMIAAVRELSRRTAVAIISGRPVAELRARLGELEVTWAGGHGAEILHPDGSEDHAVEVAAVSPTLDELETALDELVGDEPGWLVERKQASLAVHHRLADPERRDELLPRVHARLEACRTAGPGFDVLSGKAVVELRPSGTDKGGALAVIAARQPDLSPVVVGDDVTDEDAFRVAIELGGCGVLVAEEPRETLAAHRLADPDAVETFLTTLVVPRG